MHEEKGIPVVKYVLTDNGIGIITLQRPHVKNAVNDFVYNGIIECLELAETDERCKLVVFTGSGSFFCAGADLNAGFDPMVGPLKSRHGTYYDPCGRFMSAVIKFTKPIVGAVNGPAVGVGATLVPHCDIVYASDSASFWCPFTQLCVCPEFCSSVTFPSILGPSLANEMLFLGKKLSAKEAKQAKFVSRILPSGEKFLDSVLALLEPALNFPNSGRSFKLFKNLSKNEAYIERMDQICKKELELLDIRSVGSESEAAGAVAFMRKSKI